MSTTSNIAARHPVMVSILVGIATAGIVFVVLKHVNGLTTRPVLTVTPDEPETVNETSSGTPNVESEQTNGSE